MNAADPGEAAFSFLWLEGNKLARRLALIIGNSVYRDSTLARLMTPDVDVGALAEILLDPELGAFEDANVLINMTSATVRRAISDFFAKKAREDLLLLYFSGHGVLDESGRLHLAVKDTDHSLLRGTAISASFITDEMDNSRSQRQVLVLDCCHSGAFARGAKGSPGITVGTASAFEGTGFGRVVLTATDATQYAWEGERIIGEAESSLFTHYIVEGLQSGAADINQDGQVTVDELYDYVYGEVVRQTPQQTPGKWSYKEQGEIVIARAAPRQQPPIVEKKQQPQVDEELEQRLEHLYTRGLSAYWLEDWDRSARSFQSIVEIQPDYRDTATKLAEARRQLDLKESYEKALTALQAGEFQQAVSALETVVAAAPGYKDAATQLEAARKRRQIADLFAQARQLAQASQWQAVINVFDRLATLDPDYADPEELLSSAQREFELQKRRADIERRYRQALQAMDTGQWQQARQLLVQIQEAEPGFEDSEHLLARVEAEITRLEASRRTQEQVGVLYEQALSLARARQWRQALEKLEEIKALDPRFPDPEGLAASLQVELSRERQETQRQNELATLYAEAVRLLNSGEYQAALEKWGAVRLSDPHYPDRQWVESTARKKLGAPSTPLASGLSISRRDILIIGLIAIAAVIAVIVSSQRTASGMLYQEDFQSGRADGWRLDPGWEVKPEGDGNYVLSGTGHQWATLVETGHEWRDYRLRFRLKLVGDGTNLNYRVAEGPTRYYIGFTMRELSLSRQRFDNFTDLRKAPASHAPGFWHNVEVTGRGGHIQVFVDGKLELDYTDNEPILQGTIAFEIYDNSEAMIDDIEVTPAKP